MDEEISWLLSSVLGADAQPTSDPFTHTFTYESPPRTHLERFRALRQARQFAKIQGWWWKR